MTFKINIANKGKTYKAETENEELVGLSIEEEIKGEKISPELKGYILKITGTSDKAGFCGLPNLIGPRLHKVLLSYETGMHKRPKKEGKKQRTNKTPSGLRLRKTVRGKEISLETVQINTKVIKEGEKKFEQLIAPKQEEKQE